MGDLFTQLKAIGEFLLEYWWAIGLLALGLWLVFRIWGKAEEYAAGRWQGVVHLILTFLFFLVLSALLFAAFWFAARLPVALLATANNTVIDIKSEWGTLPPLGTRMSQETIGGGKTGSEGDTPGDGQSGGGKCEAIPPGTYTVTFDPSATLRAEPSGSSKVLGEIPKGSTVEVTRTSCGDGYTVSGESRRVQVNWDGMTGWLHAITIK